MLHQVSAKEGNVINSGITEDYKQAFVEYIYGMALTLELQE